MPAVERDDILRSILISLDIPRLFYVPSEYDESVLGPYTPDFFDRYPERRKAAELSAQTALDKMSDLQLWHLNEENDAIKAFELEHGLFDAPEWYAGGFGARPVKDLDYWVMMPTWDGYEATCLSIGFSPNQPKVPPDLGSGAILPPGPMTFFHKRHKLICRAFGKDGEEGVRIAPSDFLVWIEKSGFEAFKPLLSALEPKKRTRNLKMLKQVDSRKHESLQKVLLAFLATYYATPNEFNRQEIQADVTTGLNLLNLTLDPKTVKAQVNETLEALPNFQESQRDRDEKGD